MSKMSKCILSVVVLIAVVMVWLPFPVAIGHRNNSNQDKRVKYGEELPDKTRRYALIVGVNKYDDEQIRLLKGAVNDAKALAEALQKYAGFPSEQIVLLTDEQPASLKPTRSNILGQLSKLSSVAKNDKGLMLVAFSGHGIERKGQPFLLPSDSRLGSKEDVEILSETAVSVASIKKRLVGLEQVVLMLDACRSDPDLVKGKEIEFSRNFQNAFSFNKVNKEVKAFATIYGTAPGQVSYEYEDKQQGYFFYILIEALKGNVPEVINKKGEITLGKLVNYLQRQVPKQVGLKKGKTQKPELSVDGYKPDKLVIAITIGFTEPDPAMDKKMTGDFVKIPAGEFQMGESRKIEIFKDYYNDDERPVHKVVINPGLEMGKYEVTQGQWEAVMGNNPSYFKGDGRLPVENVTWDDIQKFIDVLNSKSKKYTYSLPKEEEWEYASRARSEDNLDAVAWYLNNSMNKTHEVGQKRPNVWELHDMFGNVWEYCSDWYEDYPKEIPPGSKGVPKRTLRVVRGGSFGDMEGNCRPARRGNQEPNLPRCSMGFRLVRKLRAVP